MPLINKEASLLVFGFPFIKRGNLKSGTMRIYLKGGQRFGRRNGKVV
jgi:hypothetical protein